MRGDWIGGIPQKKPSKQTLFDIALSFERAKESGCTNKLHLDQFFKRINIKRAIRRKIIKDLS